jgi:hypothetical protein
MSVWMIFTGKEMVKRRDFIKMAGLGTLGLAIPDYQDLSKIPSPDYYNISHTPIKWKYAAEGLDFSRTEIYRGKELVDIIATIKINPDKNKIRAFNEYTNTGTESLYIESWQEKTNALAMINSNQYMSNPNLCPCALVICDGEQKGPKYNKYSRGMLVAEPKDLSSKLKKADILDFDYDSFDYKTTPYTQGVQHWPILLDREGRIKVKETKWQANRTVVAKTKEDEILFMTTEGGYFTLYNLGAFLKESNQRMDKGFNVHTAMNMDGGYEAEMVVKTPNISYVNYGEFETQGKGKDMTIFDIKTAIPGVIGIFPRD